MRILTRASPLVTACLVLVALPGCDPACDRKGCDALGSAATDDHVSSLAGVVAYQSDVVSNGCQECVFSSARLSLWPVTTPVVDQDSAKAIVEGSSTPITIQADQRYRQALDPGTYLVCQRPSCTSVDIVAGHVTPMNVKMMDGPTQFIVFDPLTRSRITTPLWDVGY